MSKHIAFITTNNFNKNKLFDITAARDNCLERYVKLKNILEEKGNDCNTIDVCNDVSVDLIICSDILSDLGELLKTIKSNPLAKVLYIPAEPPVISCMHNDFILSNLPFDLIAYWNDEFVRDNRNAVKCNIGQPVIDPGSIPKIRFSKKKFLVSICSSKLIRHKNGIHIERFRAFNFFSNQPKGIDLYGIGWDSTTYPFVKTSYRGPCQSKKNVLQDYRFSICFENAKGYPGLITEKIFDCFASGVVPIYYGPPNVYDYIPEDCFIDFCRFTEYKDLYDYLSNMCEEEHQAYLDAARRFILSSAYDDFTSTRYAEVINQQVQFLSFEPAIPRTIFKFKWQFFKVVLRYPVFFLWHLRQCRHFLSELIFTF